MKSRLLILAATLATVALPVAAREINGCTIGPAMLCVERDLRSADLRNANLARADFSMSDLSGADLTRANLLSADLDQVKLNRASLARANLEGADLTRAELFGSNLRGAVMRAANLHSADLNGAILDGARLDGANLSGANLPGASLHRATLKRADLTGAVLSNADLRGADLTGANLRNATLVRADLTGARLVGAIFDGATLTGCVGCPQRNGATAPVNEPQASALKPGAFFVAEAGRALDESFAGGCWARLYVRENFEGDPVTLVGPVAIDNVSRQWGFPWDPQYESLQVGPTATLTLYDNTRFRDRTAVFKSGRRIADMDDEMGVFRSVRSAKVSCS